MSVLTYIDSLASTLNLAEREATSIASSISTLSRRLNAFFGDNIKKHIQFGSSIRSTALPRRVDPCSDVDYMIVFKNASNYRPQTFITQLKRFAEYYYSSSEIKQSHPTVVLSLNHISFDLVPAYESWLTLYIPGPKSGFSEWISTDPISFSKELVTANNAEKYKIKPLIRVMKYWNAQNGYVFNSYELEKRLIQGGYWFCANLKEYLYSAVGNLPSFLLADWKRSKVQRARDIIVRVKKYESDGMPAAAETEIRKLLPEF